MKYIETRRGSQGSYKGEHSRVPATKNKVLHAVTALLLGIIVMMVSIFVSLLGGPNPIPSTPPENPPGIDIVDPPVVPSKVRFEELTPVKGSLDQFVSNANTLVDLHSEQHRYTMCVGDYIEKLAIAYYKPGYDYLTFNLCPAAVNDQTDTTGYAMITILGDGNPIFETTVNNDTEPQDYEVDLNGASRFDIVVEFSGTGMWQDIDVLTDGFTFVKDNGDKV